LAFQVTKLVELVLLNEKSSLKLYLLRVHLLELLSVLLFEICLERLELLAVIICHVFIEHGEHAVWQVLLEDLLLLLQLLVRDLVKVADFAVLSALLHVAHNLSLHASVLILSTQDVFLKLLIDFLLLALESLDFLRLMSA